MNPALGPLGGFEVNYSTWLQWFLVPGLVYTVICFVVIYFLFLPPKGKSFDPEIARKLRLELGPLSFQEKKAIFWLSFAVVLWATGGVTGLRTGFAAALVAALMMLPRVGMMTFKEFIQKTDWNAIFMLMGVLAIGTLGVTGFAAWIWGHILPAHMSENPMFSIGIVSFLVELLHIPLGSTATAQALAVPSLAEYAASIGVSHICISFVAYMSIVGQFFFLYQNAALVVGYGYGLWQPRDIVKYGAVMFILTPITFGFILYPWWVFMGWIL
jgi:di/tricarboxylate transporter